MNAEEKLRYLERVIDILRKMNLEHAFEIDDEYPYSEVEDLIDFLVDYDKALSRKS